jgi:lactobin A/cerein 7B family class IIb bacteriocin
MNNLEMLELVPLNEAEMAEIDGGIGPFLAGLAVGASLGAGLVVGIALVYVAKELLN